MKSLPSLEQPRRLNIKLLAAVVVLLALPRVYAAGKNATTDYSCYTGKILHWPSVPRPQMRWCERTEKVDGWDVRKTYIEGDGLKIQLGGLDDFLLGEKNPRYSISFQHRLAPAAVLGTSIFKKNELMPEITEETLAGYLKGLLKDCPAGGKINIIQGPKEQPEPGMGFNYVIIYEYENPENKEHYFRAEQFYLFEDRVVVFTYQNEPARFDLTKDYMMAIFGSYLFSTAPQ